MNSLLSRSSLIKFSSLSASTKIEEAPCFFCLIRLSVLLSLSELKEKRIWLREYPWLHRDSQCSSPPSKIVLNLFGELYTKLKKTLVLFETLCFTRPIFTQIFENFVKIVHRIVNFVWRLSCEIDRLKVQLLSVCDLGSALVDVSVLTAKTSNVLPGGTPSLSRLFPKRNENSACLKV